MHNRLLITISALFIATAAIPTTGLAATITAPEIQFSVMVGNMPMPQEWTDTSTFNSTSGAYDADGMRTMDGVWAFTWDMSVDPDPFITSTLTFTNLASTTQTFSALATLPTSTSISPSFMSGSSLFSVTDTGPASGGDGSAAVSNALVNGVIDGSNALLLQSASIGCGPTSPTGCTATTPTSNVGPATYSALVLTDIGIQLDFTLTAGDTVQFNSFFEVIPIPLPAAVWLLISGLITLGSILGRGKVKQT